MKTCKICGRSFDDENRMGVIVNKGMNSEHFTCEDCVSDECNNGHITSCEGCGLYLTPDRLHDKHTGDFTFIECPACRKGIVECVSRERFEGGHFLPKYPVTVRMDNYSRRCVIFAQNPIDMVRKLIRRTELCSAVEISYPGVLMDEDVIK